jgi:hypothetical protein
MLREGEIACLLDGSSGCRRRIKLWDTAKSGCVGAYMRSRSLRALGVGGGDTWSNSNSRASFGPWRVRVFCTDSAALSGVFASIRAVEVCLGAGVGGGEFSAEVSAETCLSFFLFSEMSRGRRLGAGRLLGRCQ